MSTNKIVLTVVYEDYHVDQLTFDAPSGWDVPSMLGRGELGARIAQEGRNKVRNIALTIDGQPITMNIAGLLADGLGGFPVVYDDVAARETVTETFSGNFGMAKIGRFRPLRIKSPPNTPLGGW